MLIIRKIRGNGDRGSDCEKRRGTDPDTKPDPKTQFERSAMHDSVFTEDSDDAPKRNGWRVLKRIGKSELEIFQSGPLAIPELLECARMKDDDSHLAANLIKEIGLDHVQSHDDRILVILINWDYEAMKSLGSESCATVLSMMKEAIRAPEDRMSEHLIGSAALCLKFIGDFSCVPDLERLVMEPYGLGFKEPDFFQLESVDALCSIIMRSPPERRAESVEIVNGLIERFCDSIPDGNYLVEKTASHIGDVSSIYPLIEASKTECSLRSSLEETIQGIIDKNPDHDWEHETSLIANTLNDGNRNALDRIRAAELLGLIRHRSAISPLEKAHKSECAESFPDFKIAIENSLMSILFSNPEERETLARLAADRSVEQRVDFIEMLKRSPDRHMTEVVFGALEDSDISVREASAIAIMDMEPKTIESRIQKAICLLLRGESYALEGEYADWHETCITLLCHDNADIRRRAARALRYTDEPSARMALLELLQKEWNKSVKLSAMESLDNLLPNKDSADAEPVRERLGSIMKMETLDEAIIQLAQLQIRLGDHSAIDAIIRIMDDELSINQKTAAQALYDLGIGRIRETQDRIKVLFLLGKTREAADMGDDAVPYIASFMRSPREDFRTAAEQSLLFIASENQGDPYMRIILTLLEKGK